MDKVSGNSKTLLIVEDSLTQAVALKYKLEREGYNVDLSCNGVEALEKLKTAVPDLIISDILMPEMNGYLLCKTVKEDIRWAHIPVILLTSLSNTDDLIMGLESNADYFIEKSQEHLKLIQRVHEILEGRVQVDGIERSFEHWIHYNGVKHLIRSTPSKTLNLLLTTYEITQLKNHELQEMQDQLRREIRQRGVLEIELEHAKAIAESASDAKSIFIANMSHEIRTPMNSILGFSELLLREGGLTPLQKERLETISHSGEHLLSLINDILDLSKIESGHVTLNDSNFDLHALMEELRVLLITKAGQKGLQLNFHIEDNVVKFVIADQGKLRQMLINLIGNAVKFTNVGSINVRVKMTRLQGDELLLVIEIEDTGPGILEADEKLFQVFEQSKAGIQSGGTGLGLAISQKFARLMGGDIVASSPSQGGSLFTLSICCHGGSADNLSRVSVHRSVIGIKPTLKPWRVMIVDDQQENRRLLLDLLTSVGFEVEAFSTGVEALSFFNTWKPHVILMDLEMPQLSGTEVIKRIKAREDAADVHTIIVSAASFINQKELLLESGADLFISKPYRAHEIYEAIESLIAVAYIYETAKAEVETVKKTFSTDDLDLMPHALLTGLKEATVNAELDLILGLLEEVRSIHPGLAEYLSALANDYQYELLLSLLSKNEA